MTLLNQLNSFYIKASAKIAQDIDENKACATLEQEIAYMVAGGRERITLETLATTFAGKLIAPILKAEPCNEELVIHPREAQRPYTQNKKASIYTVGAYSVLMSGYTSVKAVKTALKNWVETDQPETKIKCGYWAKRIVSDFIKYEIIEDKEEVGRLTTGEYFKAYPVTGAVQFDRITKYAEMLENARPRMKPMKHKVTWKLDGTCEIPNIRLNAVNPTQHYIDALNKTGHTAYKLNAAILGEVWSKAEQGIYAQMDTRGDSITRSIDALTALDTEQAYYFPMMDDRRGREYMLGGMTTPQGFKDMRAAWDFAEYRPVNEEGLFLHIANAYDMDKISIDCRIAWVKSNHEMLMNQPASNLYAERARLAYVEYKTTGKTNVICRIDGTCSGVQITSGLYLDKQTGATVNITPSKKSDIPADLYGIIAKAAQKLAAPKEAKLFAKYGRKLTKDVIMILAYGAGQNTRIKAVEAFLELVGDTGNAKQLEKNIMAAIRLEASAITKLNTNLQRVLNAKPTHEVSYKLSDVTIKLSNVTREHLTVRGTAYSTMLAGEAKADLDKFAAGIAPNFVHSLDAELLRKAINRIDDDVSPIHDDIGVHSDSIGKALKAVRKAYIETIEAQPLAALYKALGAQYFPQDNGLDLQSVKKSKYIFS